MSNPVATTMTIRAARFTPGPWHRNIKPAHKYNTIFAGNAHVHVCHLAVHGPTHEQIESNCKLILAAPDMYALIYDLVWSDRKTRDIIDDAHELLKAIDV